MKRFFLKKTLSSGDFAILVMIVGPLVYGNDPFTPWWISGMGIWAVTVLVVSHCQDRSNEY